MYDIYKGEHVINGKVTKTVHQKVFQNKIFYLKDKTLLETLLKSKSLFNGCIMSLKDIWKWVDGH